MRAPIGIEGTEESLGLNDLPQAPEAAQGPFFLDEEGRRDLGRRIVHRHNQIPLAAGHPLMRGAVLMQHHARQGFAGPLLAMRAALRSPGHVARGLQSLLRPRI